jgi:hypothetical protein
MWDLELKSPPVFAAAYVARGELARFVRAFEHRLEVIEDGTRCFDPRAKLRVAFGAFHDFEEDVAPALVRFISGRRHYVARRIEHESDSRRSEPLTTPPIPVEKEQVLQAPMRDIHSNVCAA